MTAVSVIVPARNAATTIGATLAALGGQDLEQPFEVVVVDDASTDDTVAVVERAAIPTRLVTQHGVGPGPARNAGVDVAGGELLAFTDADCVPTPEWLRVGIEGLAEADLVQGAVRPDPGVRRRPFDRTIWVTRESGLYESASLFVRRELFQRLGGFEDWLGARIGKPLAEDLWFGAGLVGPLAAGEGVQAPGQARSRVGGLDELVDEAFARRGLGEEVLAGVLVGQAGALGRGIVRRRELAPVRRRPRRMSTRWASCSTKVSPDRGRTRRAPRPSSSPCYRKRRR